MSARLRITYLSGETVYLRSLVLEDKEHAAAWFRDPYPVNATKAEEYLRETHKSLSPRDLHLAIVRARDDAIVGSVALWTDDRVCYLNFRMAPWVDDADRLQADALRLLVPWLRDESEMMSTVAAIAADEVESVAAAEELGMYRAVTSRQWLARPGGRVDEYWYQGLNANWRAEE